MPSCLTPSVFGSLGSYFRTAVRYGFGPGMATELRGGGPPIAAGIGHEQGGGRAGKITHPVSSHVLWQQVKPKVKDINKHTYF